MSMMNFLLPAIAIFSIVTICLYSLIAIIKQSYLSKSRAVYLTKYLFIATSSEAILHLIQIFTGYNFGKFPWSYTVQFATQMVTMMMTMTYSVYFLQFFIRKLCYSLKLQRFLSCTTYWVLFAFITIFIPEFLSQYKENFRLTNNISYTAASGFNFLNYFNNFSNEPLSYGLITFNLIVLCICVLSLLWLINHKKTESKAFTLFAAFILRELYSSIMYVHTFQCVDTFNTEFIADTIYIFIYAMITFIFYQKVVEVNKEETSIC